MASQVKNKGGDSILINGKMLFNYIKKTNQ